MLVHKLMGTSGAKDVEFVSSSIGQGSQQATVPAPANIQDGDLLVAYGFHQTSGRSMTAPSGFTIRLSNTAAGGGNASIFIATKVASGESGDYVFGGGGPQSFTVALLVYRNATDTDRLIGAETGGDAATSTAASISPTSAGALLAFYGMDDDITVSSGPSGMTQRAINSGNRTAVAVYDIVPNGTGVTGDKTLTWSQSSTNSGIQMQIYKG